MPRSALLSRLVFGAVVGVVALGRFPAQQAAGVYTAEQAQSGRALYDRNCAACHGAGFEGSGDAPALAGGTFLLKWRPKMVSELFGLVLQTMPPANPGSLDESAALNATAYILQWNGAQAGPLALRPGDTTQVGAIATGQAPSAAVPVQGRGGRGGTAPSIVLGAGSADGRGRGASGARGVSVAGEVPNYVPVTRE